MSAALSVFKLNVIIIIFFDPQYSIPEGIKY